MGLFVSDCGIVKWTSRAVEKTSSHYSDTASTPWLKKISVLSISWRERRICTFLIFWTPYLNLDGY
jgi:hypothetical protein